MSEQAKLLGSNLPPILPVGTTVVLTVEIPIVGRAGVRPQGSPATVVQSPIDPHHHYRVRFPGGEEASILRHQLQALGEHQDAGLVHPLNEHNLFDSVIYRCIIGSRAYGLDRESSDTDLRGVYLPPAHMHWSLYGVPEQIERKESEECYWEFQKFVTLALKANPNILECLYTPLVLEANPIARQMLDIRQIFLSKIVYQTYNGYVMSQFKKLEHDLASHGQIKPKHAMHLIRLLLSGITILKDGYVPVNVESNRDRLLAIRDAQMNWSHVNAWRLELHKEFDAAFAATKLPDWPEFPRANELLLDARKSMIKL